MLILAELAPLDPVTGLRATVRLSGADVAEVCGYGDEEWFPAISQQQGLGFALFDGAFQDGSRLTPLTMTAGLSAYIAQYPEAARYVWTGAPASILAYEDGAATTLIDGKIRSAGSAAYTFEFAIEVDEEPFKADVLSYYAGTTGLEGHGNLKGRPKPWLLGRCLNVEPVYLDLVDNVYQLSAYGGLSEIQGVYERGASFGASVDDFASLEALVAADIPAGRWGTCLAQGLFRLGAPAAGVITADAIGDPAGGRKTGGILKRIASHLGITKVLTSSLDALDSAVPRNGGEYITDQTSFLDLAQRMALVRNAVAGIDWTGNLFVTRVAETEPVLSLDAQGRTWPPVTNVIERGVSPPFKRIAFGAERSWRVHTLDEIAFDEPLTDRGAWVAGEWYKRGNLVTHPDGKLWLYIASDPGNQAEPGTDASVWSNRSSKFVPTGAYDAARTYYPDDLTTWTDGNAYVRIGTGPTTGVDPSDDTKWQFFLGGNDTITQDGRIQRRVYITSATQPDTPTGDNVPEDWSDDPTDQPRWVSEALQELDFTLVEGETWSVPKEDGHKGEPGLNGFNRETIQIFAQGTSVPPLPSNTLTYNFVNDTLTGLNNGWARFMQADNGEGRYTTFLSFGSRADSDTLDPANIPPAVALPGGGANGVTFVPIDLYKRAPEGAPPDVPSGDVIVNLATGAVSGQLDGWTKAVPANNGQPVYNTFATAFGTTGSDAILPSEWEPPVVVFRDGVDGADGASAFSLTLANLFRQGSQLIHTGAATRGEALTVEAFEKAHISALHTSSPVDIGLSLRDSAGNEYGLWTSGWFRTGTRTWYIHETEVDATDTNLVAANGQTFSVRRVGSELRAFVNGVDIGTPLVTNVAPEEVFRGYVVVDQGQDARIDDVAFRVDGSDGEDGFTISPASYSATVAASSSSVVETGQLPITVALKLLRGTTDLTADAATSYALSQTGGAGTLGGANNSVLSINSIAADTYKGTVSVSYNGVVIGSVEATVTKSKQGSAAVSAKDTSILVPTTNTYGTVHGGPLTVVSGTDGSVKLSCSIIYETTTNAVRLAGKIQYRTSTDGEAYSAWADAAPETEASEIAFPGEPGFLAFSHSLPHSGEGLFYQTRLQLRATSSTVPSVVRGNFSLEWSA